MTHGPVTCVAVLLRRGYLEADVANIVRDNCMGLFHQVKET
jgi:hypothetical protein